MEFNENQQDKTQNTEYNPYAFFWSNLLSD